MHFDVHAFSEGRSPSARRHLSRLRTELRANRKLILADAAGTALAAPVALVLAAGARFGLPELHALARFIPLAVILALPVFVLAGFYRRHRHSSSPRDLGLLLPGVAAYMLLLATVGWAGRIVPEVPLSTYPIMYLALLPVLGAARLVARQREFLRHRPAEPAEREPVLLVGLGPTAELFLRAANQGLSRYRVTGIIDTAGDSKDLLYHSVPILGSTGDTQDILRQLATAPLLPRAIFLTQPVTHSDSDGIAALLNWAEGAGIRVRALPQLTEAGLATPGTGSIAAEDVLNRPQKSIERLLLRQTYCGRRVLVTGAGGSIGSELVRQIASLEPSEIVLIENSEFNAYQVDRSLARHFPNVRRHLHICCIRDRERLMQLFRQHRPDLVFNAAALKHVPLVEQNPCEGVLTNVIGTRNVCDAAREIGARAMVQVSTDKAVNTTNVMGATKRVGEFYCQAQDLITREVGCDTRFFAVRFGNVLGSSGSLVPLFQEQIAQGGPLTITDPRMERYFMTIREAVELTLLAAAQGLKHPGETGRIFVLDMGRPLRIVDLAERMIRMAGKVPGKDIRIEFIGIRPGEKLFEELFDRDEIAEPAGFAGVNCATPCPIPISRLRRAMLHLEVAARAGDVAAVRAGLVDLVPGYGKDHDDLPRPERPVRGETA